MWIRRTEIDIRNSWIIFSKFGMALSCARRIPLLRLGRWLSVGDEKERINEVVRVVNRYWAYLSSFHLELPSHRLHAGLHRAKTWAKTRCVRLFGDHQIHHGIRHRHCSRCDCGYWIRWGEAPRWNHQRTMGKCTPTKCTFIPINLFILQLITIIRIASTIIGFVFLTRNWLTDETLSTSTLHLWQKNRCGGGTTTLSAIFAGDLFAVENRKNCSRFAVAVCTKLKYRIVCYESVLSCVTPSFSVLCCVTMFCPTELMMKSVFRNQIIPVLGNEPFELSNCTVLGKFSHLFYALNAVAITARRIDGDKRWEKNHTTDMDGVYTFRVMHQYFGPTVSCCFLRPISRSLRTRTQSTEPLRFQF